MSFNEGDKVRIKTQNIAHSQYEGKEGEVVGTYSAGGTYRVSLEWEAPKSSMFEKMGVLAGFFESELELVDVKREALIELAETLDSARLQANAIEEMAPQSWVYGDIAQVLVVVLCALTGRFEVGDIYDLLLDGNTVREALEVVAKNGK